ncbi:zinc finger protein 862-like [Ylistrum balloti]|uniref:zinc finger protein 862-like n=1 Tax=Ylistrum balloti TaxID=509963 RepID=UPI002905AE20|nr:zinc finger protein 862-like [Ylistrum balloti]
MSDNCSVMTGRHNSVISRIREVQPDIFDLGCVCHLANLCTVAAVKTIPLPVEDLLIDIFYHFHHSAKRKEEYKEFLDFLNIEPAKILKHCSTRWLSLQRAVERTLHHWPALKSYFLSHEDVEKPGRVKRCADLLSNSEMLLYFHFLQFILPFLVEFNTMFQADDTRLPYLGKEMQQLLRKLLGKFVLAKTIREAEDVTAVPYRDTTVHLKDPYLAVGLCTRAYLSEHDEDTQGVTARFFSSVRRFYIAAVDKMVKKFPFHDPVINKLQFLVPSSRDHVNPADVVEIGKRFPSVIQDGQLGTLEEEYREFQLCPDADLPKWEDGKTPVDSFWGGIASCKTAVTRSMRFPILYKLATSLCTLPNSNADCERVFSVLRKVQTDQRSLLDRSTLSALLTCKLNRDEDCYNYKPSTTTLATAKSTCVSYNKELSCSPSIFRD